MKKHQLLDYLKILGFERLDNPNVTNIQKPPAVFYMGHAGITVDEDSLHTYVLNQDPIMPDGIIMGHIGEHGYRKNSVTKRTIREFIESDFPGIFKKP